MAREAARLLEGSNWLPEPLRLTGDDLVDDAAAQTVTSDAPDDTAIDREAVEDAEHLQAAE